MLIQHISIYPGDGAGDIDAMQIGDNLSYSIKNIVLDHVSLAWAADELFSITNDVDSVSCRNILLAEPLLARSVHSGKEQSFAGLVYGTGHLDMVGNYFAHAKQRTPTSRIVNFVYVNNLLYDKKQSFVLIENAGTDGDIPLAPGDPRYFSYSSFVGNVFRRGPSDNLSSEKPIHMRTGGNGLYYDSSAQEGSEVYVKDNFYLDTAKVLIGGDSIISANIPSDNSVQSAPRWVTGLTAMRDKDSVEQWVLANVGSRPASRNFVDTYFIRQYNDGEGGIKDCMSGCSTSESVIKNDFFGDGSTPFNTVDSLFNYFGSNTRAFTDTVDHDQLASDGSGYTNLEKVLHSMAAALEPGGSPSNQAPTVTASASSTNVTTSQSLTFDANANDTDGSISSYAWDFGDGNSSILEDPTHSYGSVGTYNAIVTVTDDDGATAKDTVVITVTTPTPCIAPTGWSTTDIGSPTLAGEACANSGQTTYTLKASGEDIWDTADEFHFMYRTLSGDGEIIAQVVSMDSTHEWAKAGVMIRNSTNANSRNAMMYLSPVRRTVFQSRTTDAASTTSNTSATASFSFPYYVRLTREGDKIKGYYSSDGSSWTVQDSAIISMDTSVLVGLALTSHTDALLNEAVFSQVQVISNNNTPPTVTASATPTSVTTAQSVDFDATGSDVDAGDVLSYSWTFGDGGSSSSEDPTYTYASAGTYTATVTVTDLAGATAQDSVTITVTTAPSCIAPSGWLTSDIGSPTLAGEACANSGQTAYTLKASGADIWGSSDEFHFMYDTLSGDGEIIARVDAMTNTDEWAKAGVMIRNSLTANSRNAMMYLSPVRRTVFQSRITDAASTTSNISDTASFSFPFYVRLTREGNEIKGYYSSNGTSWTVQDSATLTLGTDVFAGLALTSHDNSTLNEADFSQVQLISSSSSASDTIYLEAECFTLGSNFSATTDASVSNGEYVGSSNGSKYLNAVSGNSADVMTQSFTVSTSGNYSIFARVYQQGAAADSYWIRINGGSWIKWNQIGTLNTWTWAQVYDSDNSDQNVVVNLSAGTHTIEIAHREPNVRLDNIYIAQTSTAPTGLGGAASNCPAPRRGMKQADMKLYPNPAENQVILEVPAGLAGKMHIRLINLQGQELSNWTRNNDQDLQLQISTSQLTNGLYLIQIQRPEGVSSEYLEVRK